MNRAAALALTVAGVIWARQIAGEASVGRPHVARALVEGGHVKDVQEAFGS